MSLQSDFPDAQEIPSLDPVISFRISDTFYYGSDSPADIFDLQRLREKLDAPNIRRASPSAVMTEEVLGHENELVTYYQQIIRLARQYERPPYSTSEYFALSLKLCNSEHEVDISFFWYDNFCEIDCFLSAIIEVSSGLVYDDQDQGWALEAHADDRFVYIREWEPESEGTRYEIIVPRDELVAKVTILRERALQIISYLSKAVGTDYWTSYADEQAMLRFKRPWWKFW
jgi:hypothetical protein